MIPAILNRRSIRKFKDTAIARETVEEILRAGSLAPSSKNRQPWKFIAVSGEAKTDMLRVMRKGILRERETPLLPGSSRHLAAADYTVEIMEQAPVAVFVMNPLGAALSAPLTAEERIYEICNAQSIGACMENMTLTATELGIGSLWICDVFFAYEELSRWLGSEGTLFAAMALGAADEAPRPRPRNCLADLLEWRAEANKG